MGRAPAHVASVAADASAGVPTPAPYDLAADLAMRLENARRELGPETVSDIEANVFLLVSPRRDAVFDASVHLSRQALAAYFNNRFSKRRKVGSSTSPPHSACMQEA